MTALRNGDFGFWMAHESLQPPASGPLRESLDTDVAIVGGGYSGLWAAIAIKRLDPTRRVVVLEATALGRGASGRNGGWLSAKTVGMRGVLAKGSGREAVKLADRLLDRAMHDTVALMESHGIDIEAVHGGWLQIARSASEAARLRASLESYRAWGVDETHLRWIDRRELTAEIDVSRAVGALRSPDCYRINPLKLLYGLATIAIGAGVELYTDSRATDITAGSLRVGSSTVSARSVVIATEGYTAQQPGRGRDVLPLNSAMIATAPLPPETWRQIGWDSRAGISGAAHTYFYGQRTNDDRIIIGGRGKPYRFGSRTDRDGEVDAATVAALETMLAELFPHADVRAEYAWCGVLGVLRDWSPIVDDHGDGVYEVGGYAGQGVTAAKVAGDTVAALITGTDAPERRIPWIRRRPRKWEPEPLRWIGANGLYRAYSVADWHEARTGSGRTSVIARLADRVAGR
ncbi:FAD-dependent oxidoreductase [Herbiconiux sp. KACC 21604]|uniref:NAD(P)/FAD-dependent oxidoreductase n=1 Tax=unclassified Herbiconiux TaxID=2618217 RepID=UPI0014920367|nr:FAD-dependent oxidoreductase [Herbiconiux sp. SALV-R1]QJU55682.1 FAD-dependent oxidoreductase [Herbiconiux sp. SALV-R1]WPO86885.1 FAD-dependent oxidoreductase [Herbiconiux sp. KACC 21604]